MTTVAGPSALSAEGLAAFMAAYVPNPIPGHAERIAFVATTFGIRAEVMLAQQVHETGWYEFPGCGTTVFSGCREFNNYCGIKDADSWAIARFDSPFLGCVAQAAHLAWYAVPEHVNALCARPWDPRHFGEVHKASAPNVVDLGGPGRWAPSHDYGLGIERILGQITTFEALRRNLLTRP